MTMSKAKYIESRYNAYVQWNLDDYGIDMDEVKDWSIHRLTLYVTFKDGTEKEYENWNDTSIDYKHGLEEVLVFDEDWNEHKGGNDKMI